MKLKEIKELRQALKIVTKALEEKGRQSITIVGFSEGKFSTVNEHHIALLQAAEMRDLGFELNNILLPAEPARIKT